MNATNGKNSLSAIARQGSRGRWARVLFRLCAVCMFVSSVSARASEPEPSGQTSAKRRSPAQAEATRDPAELAAVSPDTRTRRKAHSNRWKKKRARLKDDQQSSQTQAPNSADGTPADPYAPTVEVFGKIGGTVYLYETQSSVEPDFITGVADLGLAGSTGPFSGRLSLSITDSGDDVAVSQAYLKTGSSASESSPWGLALKLGRDFLPGVSGYGAAFNHGSLGSGNSDGAFLDAGLKGGSLLEWNTGAGVVNALSEDVSTGFGKRSQQPGKAWFAWSNLSVSVVKAEFLYARQDDQMRADNDETTAEIDESRSANFHVAEGSVGVSFDWFEAGGFMSRRVVGAEEGQPTAEQPLAHATTTDNVGGGVKLKTGPGLFTEKTDSASLTAGYSTSTRVSQEKKQGSEGVIAATLGYAFGPAALGLNLGFFEGQGDQVYDDERSGRSYTSIQRVGLDFSYKFSK